MSTHDVQVKRSGSGVAGVCSCRAQQMPPVQTRQEAEDWCHWHLQQVALALADPQKKLTDSAYLKFLQDKAADTNLPPAQREQWKMLAEEFSHRVKGKRSSYDTGVETEPLF